MTTKTKKPTLKSLQMKVAALSKDLEQKNQFINAQKKQLETVSATANFWDDKYHEILEKYGKLKDETTHYKCERMEAITALVEVSNSRIIDGKKIALNALKQFRPVSEY